MSLSCFDLSALDVPSDCFFSLLPFLPRAAEFPPARLPAEVEPAVPPSLIDLFGVFVPPRLIPPVLAFPALLEGVESRRSSLDPSERSDLSLSSFCCFFGFFLEKLLNFSLCVNLSLKLIVKHFPI